MPTKRNPSHTLADAEVDDIVDRLLRGKYEKWNPVKSIEVVRAGLMGKSVCREYVIARWGVRNHYQGRAAAADADASLTQTGVTMRSNKLWERASSHVTMVTSTDNEELVWRVWDGRSYDTLCFAVGSRASAIAWSWTLFGWLLPEGSKQEQLRAELAGGGGMIAASAASVGLTARLAARVSDLRGEAARNLTEADRLEAVISSLNGAAAHLASSTGATG